MMKQGGGINLRISKGKHRRSYCIPRWKERKSYEWAEPDFPRPFQVLCKRLKLI